MPNFKPKYQPKKKPLKRGSDDRKTWIDTLDKVFSLYVRMRDSKPFKFGYFRCISCGRILPVSEADAGHYIGRGNMALRWESSNVWSECKACNRFDSSHLIGYRKNLIIKFGTEAVSGSVVAASLDDRKRLELIRRIGEQKVQALEAQKKTSKKWTVEEMKQMYAYYAALVLEMKNEM